MNINEQLLVFYNNNLNTGIHDNQVMGGQGEKYPSSYYFSNDTLPAPNLDHSRYENANYNSINSNIILGSSGQYNDVKNSDDENSAQSPMSKEQDMLYVVSQSKPRLNLVWLKEFYAKILSNQVSPCELSIQVRLVLGQLWQEFHTVGTEMIITKCGRRMFPNFKINISSMKAHEKYILLMDVVPADSNRYKYKNYKWKSISRAEPHSQGRFYIHPDSPATGTHWMKQPIMFQKLKLTNNLHDENGHIVLNSMHKYLPRVHVLPCGSSREGNGTMKFSTFKFEETKFIAVTAYQNERITELKIRNNPFARGIRNNSHHGKKEHFKPETKSYTTLRNKEEVALPANEINQTESCSHPLLGSTFLNTTREQAQQYQQDPSQNASSFYLQLGQQQVSQHQQTHPDQMVVPSTNQDYGYYGFNSYYTD